ncbi:bacteriophage N4 adsorption protein A [Qipengyuania sphaerica]|uniref:bacteriophage N4 adsorption protein A n=1 Tax=Qipengyuania sphaerica TaxID=2867243 RepID=UPI001C868F06|nr:bacteriophage N4 adsorption protein A [Qipengyuania sphaerica]MBX7541703.1 bacteriophage N4 adsorption protein A [Qipengyuania sphaerica]
MRAIGLGVAVWISCAGAALAQETADDPFADYAAGRYVAAEMGAEAALSKDPANPVWWALLAESRAKLNRPRDAAAAFGRAAEFETDHTRRSYFLRAQVLQFVAADLRAEAQAVVRSAIADDLLDARHSLDWAMVTIAADDDRAAQDILSNEPLHGDFTRQSALDAAYSAKRRGLDQRAAEFFEAGLALDGAEPSPLSDAQRENIRREVRELTRDWAFLSQASYSSSGRPDGLVPQGDAEVMQLGAELSRRIGGWQGGRPCSLFARVFHSEFLGEDRVLGNATQGWVGLRYKPLAALNLNLEASRLVGFDDQGIEDWSVRVAISAGEGLEPEVGRRNWTYLHAYGDISYLLDNDVTFGIAEGRYGRAFALGGETTITPYAVARAGLDTGRVTDASLGGGAGVNLRHWFGGDATTAPRGFIDFDLQARERIAGDESASGVLASITFGR